MLRKIRQRSCLPVCLSVLLLLSGLVLFTQESALAAPRTALVIGNSAYPSAPLKNPANDAADMAAALKKLGFEVSLLKNATMQQMEEAVREFGLKLRKGGTGLFYFAGHGVQVAGENYLVPVNAAIQSEGDVKYGCLNAGLVLAKMEDAGNGPNVVILDACRNNPFARSFRSAEAGLARMDAPTGSIIAYATAPGKVASDGEGRNGLYTQHLLRNIATPGLSVTDLFMSVREAVVRDSAKKQVPWENTSLIGRFSLAGQVATTSPVAVAAPAPQAVAVPVAKPASVASLGPQNQRAPAPTAEEARLLKLMRELDRTGKGEDSLRELTVSLAAKGSIYGAFAQGRRSNDEGARHKAIEQAARRGIPLAMVDHAKFLAHELGTPEEQAEARVWLQTAVALGETSAKVSLGDLLIRGLGGPKDVSGGERLFAEAMREEPVLCGSVSTMYFNYAETVMPGSEAKAKALAARKRGAAYGDTHSMLLLGNNYWRGGYGRPEDRREAYDWFVKAAEKGSAEAMVSLGSMLLRGAEPDVAKDQAAAAKWFRKAAEAGYESGTIMLAQMHLMGDGVPKDTQRGLSMLRTLAEKGSGDAQFTLGLVHDEGIGVPVSLPEAYYWFVVADAGGNHRGASFREIVGEKLTARKRAEIEARAAKWKPKKAK